MIKVLHVISDTNIGGAGVLLCNLLASTNREEFEPMVALPQTSILRPRIEMLGVSVIPLDHGADNSSDLRAVPEMIAILRRIRPHVLHTHSALYARLAGMFCSVPVKVNTRHCANQNEKVSWRSRLAGYIENHLNTHTIATADYVEESLTARGLDPRRIHVIHNGSLPVPSLNTEERTALASDLGIDCSRLTVGIVARLAEGKGHETFLRAASLCLSKTENIEFLVVGDGEKRKELHHIAHALGIADKIHFLGFRDDVGRIMNLLDVNVNCSELSETSSLSLSEGLSLGVIPVVTDCGGNPFMAGFGTCGLVFPAGGADRLAKILLSLLHDRDRLTALSVACQRHFSAHFTAENMTAKTEALYKTLLNITPTSIKIAKYDIR